MHTSVFQNDGQSIVYLSTCSYNLPYCHLHNHNELLFLMSGKLHLENNLNTIEVTAPAVIIHNCYTLHRAQLLEGHYTRFIINFDDSTLDTVLPLKETIRFFKNANMTVIHLNQEMQVIMENYVARYSALDAQDGSRNTLTCLILYELAQYRSPKNTLQLSAPESRNAYINEVMQYIARHYSEDFTLDDLAARFYISRAKLSADFSAGTNMTIKQYTTLVRMNIARELLEKGNSISDTARACGYNSTGNFTATYTKYFGEKPIKKKHG